MTSVELSRQKIVQSRVVTEHLRLDITKEGNNPALEVWDTVVVPMVKDAGVVQQVNITGQVRYPGWYTINEGERLSDVIDRAGGFLPESYLYGAAFFSRVAQDIQQKSIDRLVQELELRLSGTGAASEMADTAAEMRAVLAARQAFIQRLKAIKSSGRIAIKLVDLAAFRGSKYDFELRAEDRLDIPQKTQFRQRPGQRLFAQLVPVPTRTSSRRLPPHGRRSPQKRRDEDYVYIHKADGTIVSAKGIGFMSSFYGQQLMPGDVIVVPEDLERVPYLRLVKDITDIVFKIAVTAGVAANAW